MHAAFPLIGAVVFDDIHIVSVLEFPLRKLTPLFLYLSRGRGWYSLGFIGMCGPKGYVFLAVLIRNRVWILHSSIGKEAILPNKRI